jgi:hypothetical protein
MAERGRRDGLTACQTRPSPFSPSDQPDTTASVLLLYNTDHEQTKEKKNQRLQPEKHMYHKTKRKCGCQHEKWRENFERCGAVFRHASP